VAAHLKLDALDNFQISADIIVQHFVVALSRPDISKFRFRKLVQKPFSAPRAFDAGVVVPFGG